MTWLNKVVLSLSVALTISVTCIGCGRLSSPAATPAPRRTEIPTIAAVLPLEATPVSIPTVPAALPLTVSRVVPTHTVVTVMALATTPISTPTATNTPSPTATPSPTPTNTPSPTAIPSPTERRPLVHTVQPGDTLYAISLLYETTIEAIMEANELSDQDSIWVDQRLLMPSSALSLSKTPTPTRTSAPTPSPTVNPIPTPTPDLCTGSIPSREAGDHVGKTTWVLCTVVATQHTAGVKAQPIFLDCDEPYPNQTLSVIIWEKDRHKFPLPPEDYYEGKTICVYGLIWTFGEKPAIVARDGSQIKVAGS